MNLATLTLKIARVVTDVLESKATAGTQASLTDTANLIQADQYFDRGTLWILSGSHVNAVTDVKGQTANKLTFNDLGAPVIAIGDRYAVARAIYPYFVIVNGITDALDETFIVKEAQPETPIIGDGQAVSFELPAGVSNVVSVTIEDTSDATNFYTSTHWDERDGYLIFDSAPSQTQKLRIYYRTPHDPLASPTTEISTQINLDWLLWKAAEYVLYWGMKQYGELKDYRIEENLNRTLTRQKGLYPRKPVIRIRTMS